VVGVLAVHLAFPGPLLVPSVLVLALADPAASVVGRLWGRRKVGKGSVEGLATFWVVAAVVLVPFVGLPTASGIAAVVALSEVLPTKLDDNLVIPFVTALALWISG